MGSKPNKLIYYRCGYSCVNELGFNVRQCAFLRVAHLLELEEGCVDLGTNGTDTTKRGRAEGKG